MTEKRKSNNGINWCGRNVPFEKISIGEKQFILTKVTCLNWWWQNLTCAWSSLGLGWVQLNLIFNINIMNMDCIV